MRNTGNWGYAPNSYSLGECGIEPQFGRLSCVKNVSFPDNSTGNETIWLVPYLGDVLELPVGDRMVKFRFDENVSFYLSSRVDNEQIYDIFAYQIMGKVGLSIGNPWFVNNSRGVSQQESVNLVNGRWVNEFSIPGGPAAGQGLLVGTLYTDASGQVDDSEDSRCLCSYLNMSPRNVYYYNNAGSHTYASSTWRYYNNVDTHLLRFVLSFRDQRMSFFRGGAIEDGAGYGFNRVTGQGVNYGSSRNERSNQINPAAAMTFPDNVLVSALVTDWIVEPGLNELFLLEANVSAVGTATFGDTLLGGTIWM